MPFGKKKNEGEAAVAAEAAPVNLFEQDAAAEAEDAAAALEESTADASAAAPAPAEPAPSPVGADALLSLFQEDEGGNEDRAIMLDMAGEVAIVDLLDDLRTLASALRMKSA